MADVPMLALDARQRQRIENARLAWQQGNAEYALDACAEVLKAVPGCVSVRRLQRSVQLQVFRTKNRWLTKAAGGLSASPFLLGFGSRSATQTLELAERLLAKDPTSLLGLKALADAARRQDWPETVVFALEAWSELRPDDRENRLALGQAWLDAKEPAKALTLAESLLRSAPADGDAQALLRRASLDLTVARGNWGAAGSFREKLKDATARTVNGEWRDGYSQNSS